MAKKHKFNKEENENKNENEVPAGEGEAAPADKSCCVKVTAPRPLILVE